MSTKGNLTRVEAIEIAGIQVVEELDSENCDFTGRCQCDGDTRVEFSSSVEFEDIDGDTCTLAAYYYQEQEDLDNLDDNDLSCLDWEIEGYEVI